MIAPCCCTIFPKNSFVVKHSGKNEIPIFSRNIPGKTKSRFFFSKIRIFFSTKYAIQFSDIVYILLFENRMYGRGSYTTFRHFCVRNVKIAKCHFLSFPASPFMPRVTYVQYLTPCGVTPGSVTRLTSILLERQQQDVRSSIWLYYKAPDVPEIQ